MRGCLLIALALSACGPSGPATPDAGGCEGDGRLPENLLVNPGFECGALVGWKGQYATLSDETEVVHGGQRAARLTEMGSLSATGLWSEADAVASPGTATYCVRAWLRGTAPNGRITVRKVLGGGVVDENFSSPLSNTEWTLVPPAGYGPLKIVAQNEERFLLRLAAPSPQPGDVLLVDDVELWTSADGSCKDR